MILAPVNDVGFRFIGSNLASDNVCFQLIFTIPNAHHHICLQLLLSSSDFFIVSLDFTKFFLKLNKLGL